MSAVETLGKYEIRRQLGRGAMGTVYEGFDPIIERIVAIKTVRLPEVADEETADGIARFRREAQAAGRLTHPNIVGVFDYGETADLAYIVMEYVDGPPLKSLLDKNERFPLPTIGRIMEDLLTGLQFSHERGVVHRDVKPANLMLTKSGQGKIADFGIARIESSSMTQAGTVLGTPAYMSPEQFMGQVVDARTDIYSAGVLLYQLLTGERPFEGSMSAIMHKALHTEAPSPSQISVTAPRPFDNVVKRAMAKRPEDRYASAAEFLAAIRTAMSAPSPPVEAQEDHGEATMVVAPRSVGASSRPASRPESAAALAASTAPPAGRKAASAQPAARAAGGSSLLPVIIVVAAVAGLGVFGAAGYFLLPMYFPELAPWGRTVQPIPPEKETPPDVPPVATDVPPVVTPDVPPVTTKDVPPVSPKDVPPVATQDPPPVTPPVVPPPVLPPVVNLNPTPTPEPPTPQVVPQVNPPVLPPVALVPPPTVNPPVLPPPVQPLPDPSEPMRAEIASFASRLPCSMLDGDIKDGAVLITGIAGRAAIDSLRQKFTAMALTNPVPSLRVTQVDPSFCPWQDLLRSITKTFGESGNRLTLHLPGDPPWLQKDDYIKPHLIMPGFRGELHVDYLDREGHVAHLYPQLGDPAQKMAADSPRVLAAGEAINIGEPGPNKPFWRVDEPYGTDLIVAIASEDTLFDRPRPANTENAATYLRDLKRAVELARSRGTRITATAIPLETRRK